MQRNHTLTMLKLSDLHLDVNNPRFAELYSGSSNEADLIEYLLYSEAAEEISNGIINANEFYPDRPLWVFKDNGKYIVKDGNRRCAAVKALQDPIKFDLKLPKFEIKELPVLIYNDKSKLDSRIFQEHTNSLFKEWDRISKALEVFKLFKSGNSLDSMKDIDSAPIQLIKIASFYYEAVKLGGEDLKKLLRRGRGKTGGKTIIFERLFKYSELCGYKFRNKPHYTTNIIDQVKFNSYIKAMVSYLKTNPSTKTQDIDLKGDQFLSELLAFGFTTKNKKEIKDPIDINKKQSAVAALDNWNNEPIIKEDLNKSLLLPSNTTSPLITDENVFYDTNHATENNLENKKSVKRKSIKTKPIYERKKIPGGLDRLIKECFSLDYTNFSNAKTALARVTFECTLKYIVENTIYKSKKNLIDSNYFRNVLYDNKGIRKPFTDFTKLKNTFALLINDTGIKKAFESFDLERTHQIIHNYHVAAIPADAKNLCDNLIPLLEFMLKEESNLLDTLDISKL